MWNRARSCRRTCRAGSIHLRAACRRPEQEIAALVDERLEQHAGAVLRPHVAQSFVVRCPGTVRCVRRRREPALVDAAAVRPERVQIVGMQPEPPAGDHERARDPARLEPQNAGAGVNCVPGRAPWRRCLGRHHACDVSLLMTSLQARLHASEARRPRQSCPCSADLQVGLDS
jgi:hypothetical protein